MPYIESAFACVPICGMITINLLAAHVSGPEYGAAKGGGCEGAPSTEARWGGHESGTPTGETHSSAVLQVTVTWLTSESHRAVMDILIWAGWARHVRELQECPKKVKCLEGAP